MVLSPYVRKVCDVCFASFDYVFFTITFSISVVCPSLFSNVSNERRGTPRTLGCCVR